MLPHSVGDEQEVVVRNNCSFPIEIYNLEFDKSYLEEEKVSRGAAQIIHLTTQQQPDKCSLSEAVPKISGEL